METILRTNIIFIHNKYFSRFNILFVYLVLIWLFLALWIYNLQNFYMFLWFRFSLGANPINYTTFHPNAIFSIFNIAFLQLGLYLAVPETQAWSKFDLGIKIHPCNFSAKSDLTWSSYDRNHICLTNYFVIFHVFWANYSQDNLFGNHGTMKKNMTLQDQIFW